MAQTSEQQLRSTLTDQLAKMPAGRVDDVQVWTAAATLVELENPDLQREEEEFFATVLEAARPEPVTGGKPTIMRLTTWMAHEGTNLNGQHFLREELQAAAEDLFREPHFGVMDYNHSAMLPIDAPQLVGVWYKAEFAYDKKAKNGNGAWGILATGMFFSWLFPELADVLLAQQARKGYIPVSMACLSRHEYVGPDQGGPHTILHDPIFFTVSVLDVPPADPDALGQGTENPETSESELRAKIAGLQTALFAMAEHQTGHKPVDHHDDFLEDNAMNSEEYKQLIEELTQSRDKALEQVTALEAKATGTSDKITELETQLAEANTKIEELTTARDAAVAERDNATARIEELEGERASLQQEVETFKAEKAEQARQERMDARLAALPEEFRRIHEGKDDEVRQRLETKWAAMEDEVWEDYVANELLGYVPTVASVDFLARSQREGTLASGGAASADTYDAAMQRLRENR